MAASILPMQPRARGSLWISDALQQVLHFGLGWAEMPRAASTVTLQGTSADLCMVMGGIFRHGILPSALQARKGRCIPQITTEPLGTELCAELVGAGSSGRTPDTSGPRPFPALLFLFPTGCRGEKGQKLVWVPLCSCPASATDVLQVPGTLSFAGRMQTQGYFASLISIGG